MGYAMPAAPAPAGAKRSLKLPLLVLGLVLLVAGIVLWFAARMRLSDGITSLAPAPAGCETALEFDGGGTYTFFVETKGELDALDGDCSAESRDYDFEGDTTPRVSLTLVDEGGDEVDLDRVEGPSYDGSGRHGVAVRTAELDEGGTYILTVDTNEPEVVVRVGKDPNRGVGTMRTSGIVLAVLGLALVLLALITGRRRPTPAMATGPTPMWQPGGGPPPVAPPNQGSPPQPPYGAPPYGGGPYGPATPPAPGGPYQQPQPGRPYGQGGQWGVPPAGPNPPPPPPPR